MMDDEQQYLADLFPARVSSGSGSDTPGNHRHLWEREADLGRPDARANALVVALRDLIVRRPESPSQRSAERNRDLAEAAQDFIFVIDLAGKIDYINRAAAEVLAVTEEQVVGQSFERLELLPGPEEAEELLARVIIREEVVQYERAVRLASGTRHLYTTLSPIKDPDGIITGILGIAKDISELARARDRLRSLSLVDELTGLYNRRGFMSLAGQYLGLAWRNRSRVCLIMADMDDLKGINDRFGHHRGDAALAALASILKDNCRQSDVAARIGGDEFVLLAPGIPEGGSAFLVARLRRAVKDEGQRHQYPYRFSASIGAIECYPDPSHSVEKLLEEADRKMYEVKRARAS